MAAFDVERLMEK